MNKIPDEIEKILSELKIETEYYLDEDMFLFEMEEDFDDPFKWIEHSRKYYDSDFVSNNIILLQTLEFSLDPSRIKSTKYSTKDVSDSILQFMNEGAEPPELKEMLRQTCLLTDNRLNEIQLNKISKMTGCRISCRRHYDSYVVSFENNNTTDDKFTIIKLN